ncbi:helix-turn-helix transcriptional regulator [Hazenella sp. IB182353]|uniref:helix-turn-helix domain-containing protein n=1 Tax=Polycladospora coralii TaxID=2771432 RepID=UPI001BCCFDB1|nr:helix-turn-helix transcriptional regulator [Polycladospora coralii]MBS7529540.1 helix-turn-helix transcriptional regulator [Polycladospora coralii]
MIYHYGLTIREGRELLGLTQAQLAEKWPQSGGGTGVSLNYVSDVERGIKNITDLKTLRLLCKILEIPLWKVGLSDFNPFNPYSISPFEVNQYGIIKLTDCAIDRISDYKNCLLDAKGDCFISGTSMIHLSEDSSEILKDKLLYGKVHLLILNPDWIKYHYILLSFIENEEDKKIFHYEIRNSIRKIIQFRKSLPIELRERLHLKTYHTVFPYIITGFENDTDGKIVFEITDYIPEKNRPRFTVQKTSDNNAIYAQVKRKFFSLWHNKSVTEELNA